MGVLERAATLADEVREAASTSRFANLEAQAEWLLRAVANRWRATDPDLELPFVIRQLGDPVLTAQAHLTEALIAWRGGHAEGHSLATTAARAFDQVSMPAAAWHASALAWACAPETDSDGLARALLRLDDPVLAIDGLGLLASAGARLIVEEACLASLISAQGDWRSPYPHGALTTDEALHRIQRAQETR